jgi:hypothetical protein
MKEGAVTLGISLDGFCLSERAHSFLSFIYNRQFAVNGYYASDQVAAKRQRPHQKQKQGPKHHETSNIEPRQGRTDQIESLP